VTISSWPLLEFTHIQVGVAFFIVGLKHSPLVIRVDGFKKLDFSSFVKGRIKNYYFFPMTDQLVNNYV